MIQHSSVDNELLDAAIVGAGFAGLYAIHRLRTDGYQVQAFERGSDVGGTWYWNRYPGARCDIESIYYSYSFSEELQQEWTWSHRYATQPEILDYLRFVADRLQLRDAIKFDTSVVSAIWDEDESVWTLRTSDGEQVTARHLIMASGGLSVPHVPDLPGIENFQGQIIHTSSWPGEIDFTGKRVGIVGTGSSCIQASPIIAQQADHLFVLQRTPQFAIPAWNRSYDDSEMTEIKARYPEIRRQALEETIGGIPFESPDHEAASATIEQREKWLQKAWERGGYLMIATYPDVLFNEETNAIVGDWVKERIRARITDPLVADRLMPTYPFAGKRLCVDTDYFEMYNRDNVTLVDLRQSGIASFDDNAVIREDGSRVEIDVLVLATGFNAMTGAMLALDIRGRDGVPIQEKWGKGAANYLGIAIAGFPNLHMINGPGSVSVLYNMIPAIEHHVDWIANAMNHLRDNGLKVIEALPEAEQSWTQHVDEVAAQTIYPKANSWYMGSNIPGKVRGFLAYAGGGPAYFAAVEKDRNAGYPGFKLTAGSPIQGEASSNSFSRDGKPL